MFRKINRADKKDLDKVFKEGRFVNSPSLSFKYLRNPAGAPRVSFVAPKSAARLASKRNLLRRKGYLAAEKFLKEMPPGLVGAFIFKKYQDDSAALQKEIETIIGKIN